MRLAYIVAPIAMAAAGLAAQSDVALRGQPMDEAPVALRPFAARAEQGMNALQAALLARLGDQMKSGGPASAVRVCRDEAQVIGARVALEQGLRLGRTSHRLRNPRNAAPQWAAALVREGAGSRAASHGVRVFDLGDRVGVARPIGFVEMCSACHGAPERIPAEVRDLIASAYPADAATGFAPGDLRGWMWAEVPKQ